MWAVGFVSPALWREETDNNTGGRSTGPNAWAGETSFCDCVRFNERIRERKKWVGLSVPWSSLKKIWGCVQLIMSLHRHKYQYPKSTTATMATMVTISNQLTSARQNHRYRDHANCLQPADATKKSVCHFKFYLFFILVPTFYSLTGSYVEQSCRLVFLLLGSCILCSWRLQFSIAAIFFFHLL